MKWALFILLLGLSFAGALAAAMALTGNLNAEAFSRLRGGPPEAAGAEAGAVPSDASILVQQLRQKEQALREREAELNAREERLEQREQDLAGLQENLTQIQGQIDVSLEEADAERKVRVQTVALTVASMDPEDAAKSLESFPPEEAAEILTLIEKDKDRGDILSEMDADTAASVLRALQERKL